MHAIAKHVNFNEIDIDQSLKKIPVGYPVIISFDISWDCNQIWELLWHSVKDFVPISFHENKHEILSVKLVDQQGNYKNLFQSNTCGTLTSLLKPNRGIKIANLLGWDCTESFLWLNLEWNFRDPSIDVSTFLSLPNHPSILHTSHIQQKQFITLLQCFSTFIQPELLDENNKWYCNCCKQHVQAIKTMELWRLPNILIIHFKRFEYKQQFIKREKLETFVDFPMELDMSDHCSHGKDTFVHDEIPAMYDLYAVINHYGRMGFGHYTAFARRWDEDRMEKEWNVYDDGVVSSMSSSDDVVTPAAYVLFYRRRIFT